MELIWQTLSSCKALDVKQVKENLRRDEKGDIYVVINEQENLNSSILNILQLRNMFVVIKIRKERTEKAKMWNGERFCYE